MLAQRNMFYKTKIEALQEVLDTLRSDMISEDRNGQSRAITLFMAHLFRLLSIHKKPPKPWDQNLLYRPNSEICYGKPKSCNAAIKNYLDDLMKEIDDRLVFFRLLELMIHLDDRLGYIKTAPPTDESEVFKGSDGLQGFILHWKPWAEMNPEQPRSLSLRKLAEERREKKNGAPIHNDLMDPVDFLKHVFMIDLTTIEPTCNIRIIDLNHFGPNEKWADTLSEGLAKGKFKIAFCPMHQEKAPLKDLKTCFIAEMFHDANGGNPNSGIFYADTTRPSLDQNEISTYIQELFDELKEEEVDLVLLPELMVASPTLEQIKDILKQQSYSSHIIKGVVAGSFHHYEPVEGESPLVNQAEFLNQYGDSVSVHLKTYQFHMALSDFERFSETDKQHITSKPPKENKLVTSRDQNKVFEYIRKGNCLNVLETSLGRLSFVICADAIHNPQLIKLCRVARLDALFILAMSSKTSKFDSVQQADFDAYGINGFFVNTSPYCGPNENLAYFHGVLEELSHDGLKNRIFWKTPGKDSGTTSTLTFQDGSELANTSAYYLTSSKKSLIVDLGQFLVEGRSKEKNAQ